MYSTPPTRARCGSPTRARSCIRRPASASAPSHRPDWVQVTPKLHDIQYVLAQDLATLVWLGNLADLELHTSLAHAGTYDCPNMVVFDLDPGPGTSIVECCEVGLLLQGMFEGLGLRTLAKTSGSKGMQVYAPL